MDTHALGIGTLTTDCRVVAYPHAVAALRSTMDRAIAGPFVDMLAAAAEPVLAGHDGIIRIRQLQLDFAHSGPFDERSLAVLLAARLAAALRQALESRSPDMRAWADPVAYMASYVEMRLGLAHEPDWAFPDFEALRLLSPVQAGIEIVKARPAVLLALARNGRRSGNALRFAERLDAASVHQLIIHLLETTRSAFADSGQVASPHLIEIVLSARVGTSGADADMAILRLICDAGAAAAAEEAGLLILTAILTVSFAAIAAEFERRHGRSLTYPELASTKDLSRQVLPPHLTAFTDRLASQAFARPLLERLFDHLAKAPRRQNFRHRSEQTARPGKAQSRWLTSPMAGLALLLPDVVRLQLHRHLGINGLRQSLLSIPDDEMRARAQTDVLIDFLYPQAAEADDPSYPPVSDLAIARLAPESRGLILGRQGAGGWGDLLLASFAGRLTGLRASSRAYLQRQFLLVSGVAEITETAVSVTLDGPPLSIILKMAGLSGDQMPVPHLNHRLLVLNVGGPR